MDDPLSYLPGYALRRASAAMMAELDQRLTRFSVRFAEIAALMLIQADEGITQSALGRALDIQRANMVPLINRLDAAGLIARTPIDRRSQGISLSPIGVARMEEIKPEIEKFERDLLARIPEEHRAHLLPALNALWQHGPATRSK
jgi:DNA-binding MarR family transcriptional regulator